MGKMTYTEIEEAIKLLQNIQRSNMEPLPLAQVVESYTADKSAVLSPHTMLDYSMWYRRLLEFVPAERPIHEIDTKVIREFLNAAPGGKKNRKNARTALGALWTYAIREGYAVDHVVRKVEIAKPEIRAIIPFSRGEVERLLKAATQSRDRLRNIAVIKTLLDTGLRASELCGITLGDLEGEYVRVLGKGSKERRVPLSALAMQSIVEYMTDRPPGKRSSPVFLSEDGDALNRNSLRLMINRLALKAEVNNAHPHKFRHTFALNYLLNGGDPYSLQIILGHSTMDMVKRYLYLTNRDIAAVHERASPLKNWRL
jgi:site-specific recombinase XerD